MGEKEAGKGKTFPYTKEACRCQNCLYHKKGGCVLQTCCCMDERVRAHTCTFAEAMNACFVQIKDFVFRYRLRLAMERAEEAGSCFLEKEHKRRFYEGLVRAKRKDNAFAAQIYLLAAAETLWKRAKRCIYTGGICYAGVDMRDAALEEEALFYAAMTIEASGSLYVDDLSDEEAVDFDVFRAVCCAVCICKYGADVTVIAERRCRRDRGKKGKDGRKKRISG